MRACKAADVVWTATAVLHSELGVDEVFSSQDIYKKVRELKFYDMKYGTIMNNITTYCVGNHPVAPSYKSSSTYKHCKLFEEDGKYRLWRRDDDPKRDPDRENGQVEPEKDLLGFEGCIKWYKNEYRDKKSAPSNVSVAPIPPMHKQNTGTPLSGHDQAPIVGGKLRNQVSLNRAIEYEPIGIVILTETVGATPPKVNEFVTRFVRSSEKVKSIKKWYDNKCQVCGYTIHTPTGRYSEVHHLHPLGEGGKDDCANMLVLCPTHHVEFDHAVLGISDDGLRVVNKNGEVGRKLSMPLEHKLDQKNIKYHLERIRLASALRMGR